LAFSVKNGKREGEKIKKSRGRFLRDLIFMDMGGFIIFL